MIVLDTHVWIWWLDGQEQLLTPRAAEAIAQASTLVVSAWSAWEIATLTRRGRLQLDRPVTRWLAEARATTNVETVPVSEDIAAAAGALPDEFPGDPSDRTIYATATVSGARLVTRDEAIRDFDPLRTIW